MRAPTPSIHAAVDWRLFSFSFIGLLVLMLGLAFYIPVTIEKLHQEKLAKERLKQSLATAQIDTSAPTTADPGTYSDRDRQAIATNDGTPNSALSAAPVDALEEPFQQGNLPRIAEDGRKPWFLYSRPFDKNDPRPKIAVVIGGLGLSRMVTDSAIRDLPGSVTLIFPSSSPAVDAWMARARTNGHETILAVPMEPLDYPTSDPGPGSILVKNTKAENIARLKDAMIKGNGYMGVTTLTGSRITNTPDQMKPILDELRARGLLFLDAYLTPLSSAYSLARDAGIPAVRVGYHLTDDMGTAKISATLAQAETVALRDRRAVILVDDPTPLTIRQLMDWIPTLPAKGFALAPISSMTE